MTLALASGPSAVALGFATSPLAQAIGWALVHLVWQGMLVAMLLWLVLAALATRRASADELREIGRVIDSAKSEKEAGRGAHADDAADDRD